MDIRERRSCFSQFTDDIWMELEVNGMRIEFDISHKDKKEFGAMLLSVAYDVLIKTDDLDDLVEESLANAIEELR